MIYLNAGKDLTLEDLFEINFTEETASVEASSEYSSKFVAMNLITGNGWASKASNA